MSANQTKYPQLRFKGFTDPWEKRTLGQTTTKAKSYSLSRDVERDHETGYRYIHYGDIHTGVADIVTEHTKLPNIEPANYDELRVNDLVVADASEDYQGIAEPAVVVGLPTHLVAGLHTITLRPSSASSLYLYYLLHTDSFKHFGYQMGTGLKVFGISWSNLSKFTFMIPSRPEQEMIVKLIESVDNLIAVNQRKLAKLKELKQGYLQKMFPQNGSKFPQLRFAGFADAWEQRKLGDLADFNPKSVLPETFEYVDLESVVGTDIISHRLEHKDSAPSRAQRLAQKGDVFYQTVRPYQKNNCIFDKLDNDWVFSTGYAQLRPKKDSYFLLVLLQNNSFMRKVLGRCTGTSYPAINSKDLAQIKVSISDSIDEQKKIGNLFRNIDNTITLHQRKLEKLQELKKGYLQKMFC
ncbi:restriction endonuclease subunit S [Lentilactobacillus kefiri]|uniref:restriction endonuclease subunit S n=1 Tax=Lentilactobacillus kefiri TaxID=33962 RepID=UPI0025A01577|nr:restriction endonuclease subunit S [Lentilactobacillus kefiri]MDM7493863.1 restriction endonuclease subunit S [Lentilactobacillus kefiri]